MFDHYGKILCIECMSGMRAIRAGPFEASFICENPGMRQDNHVPIEGVSPVESSR